MMAKARARRTSIDSAVLLVLGATVSVSWKSRLPMRVPAGLHRMAVPLRRVMWTLWWTCPCTQRSIRPVSRRADRSEAPLVHSCVERRAFSEARRASISASLCSIVLRANSDPLRSHVLGLSIQSLSAETTTGVYAFDLFKRTMTTLLPSPSRSMSRMPEASARSTRRGKP